MKICTCCKQNKTLESFGVHKSKKDGLSICCKDCSKLKSKTYREKNSDKIKDSLKKWREKNKETRAEYRKQYYIKNKSIEAEVSKKYREKNKEKIAKKEKEYRENNREVYLEKKREYFRNNKHKHAKYVTARRKNDPTYRIVCSLRGRLKGLLKGKNKSASTMQLIGCSLEDLWSHLESQFTEGMTRDNHGKYGWHIDHIIPCSSFDLSDPEQQRKCFHYTNLQPLWAKDNIKKGNKIICPNII